MYKDIISVKRRNSEQQGSECSMNMLSYWWCSDQISSVDLLINDTLCCVVVYVLPGLQGDTGNRGPSAKCNCSQVQTPERLLNRVQTVSDTHCWNTLLFQVVLKTDGFTISTLYWMLYYNQHFNSLLWWLSLMLNSVELLKKRNKW